MKSLFVTLITVLMFQPIAHADGITDSKATIDALDAIIVNLAGKKTGFEKTYADTRVQMKNLFDIEKMTKKFLGSAMWKGLSTNQQAQAKAAMEDYMVYSFVNGYSRPQSIEIKLEDQINPHGEGFYVKSVMTVAGHEGDIPMNYDVAYDNEQKMKIIEVYRGGVAAQIPDLRSQYTKIFEEKKTPDERFTDWLNAMTTNNKTIMKTE